MNLAYSRRNRSASIRIPTYSPSPKVKRIEVRFPDPSGQRLRGVRGDVDGGPRRHRAQARSGSAARQGHLLAVPRAELKNVPSVPGCLEDALEALRKDHEFLLKGDVFTEDLIETWIDYKYDRDVNPMRSAAASLGVRPVLRLLIREEHASEKPPPPSWVRGFFRPEVRLKKPTRRRCETPEG